MVTVLVGLIALALTAAGVGTLSFSKLAQAGSSGSSSGKTSNKLSSFWEALVHFFGGQTKQEKEIQAGLDAEREAEEAAYLEWISNPANINPYGGTSRGEAPPGDVVNPSSAASLGVPTQTSAQGNVATVPDVGSVAGHIEDTENGGSGQGVSNTTDWLKQIMATLGISSLFGDGEGSEHSWLSYEDIVNDERLYGEGAIADARRWQEYMAGTAYQRTVKDIQAAGLNPWLAVQSGSLSPASWGAVDTGSALGNISTSLGQTLSNSNSNSSSAIIVALIMMLAKVMMS